MSELLAHKAVVISFIHYRLSFSFLRAAILCLSGNHSTTGLPQREVSDVDFYISVT